MKIFYLFLPSGSCSSSLLVPFSFSLTSLFQLSLLFSNRLLFAFVLLSSVSLPDCCVCVCVNVCVFISIRRESGSRPPRWRMSRLPPPSKTQPRLLHPKAYSSLHLQPPPPFSKYSHLSRCPPLQKYPWRPEERRLTPSSPDGLHEFNQYSDPFRS